MPAGGLALLVLLGLAVGALGTAVGAGGGFVLTPLLLVLSPSDSPETLTAITLAVVLANAATGSATYALQRRIDVRSGLLFAAATLPGAVAGALAVRIAPRRLFDALMAVLLAALGAWLLAPSRGGRRSPRDGSPRRLTDRDGVTYSYRARLGRGALCSAAAGFVSSFLGIGGGIIHVPLLVGALGFPVHVATATSHFVLAIMSAAATVTHVAAGSFAHGHGVRRALALSVGVVAGAPLGARLSTRLSGAVIRRMLAAGLLLLAARLIVAGL